MSRSISTALLVTSAFMLTACGSNPQKTSSNSVQVSSLDNPEIGVVEYRPRTGTGGYRASKLGGDYASYAATRQFVNKMVDQHGFSRSYMNGLFSKVDRQDGVLEILNRPSRKGPARKGSWTRYRNIFMTEKRMREGAEFMTTYRKELNRAYQQYGVPPEYITAIIGVETYYGGNIGKIPVLDALATIAFDYPRRSKYFTKELEQFLLMTREEGFDPKSPVGSYAGAMGLGQFMPSSFRRYAVDFDGNGRRDLWNTVDAIGSVANYFSAHGWQKGGEVAVPASFTSTSYRSMKTGYRSKHSLGSLRKAGIRPNGNVNSDRVSLLKYSTYDGDELWLGMHNFYVITRYNHSSKYALAIHQLAQEVKRRHDRLRFAWEPQSVTKEAS